MNRYDFDLDIYGENSLTVIISMLEHGSRILEIGSAYGRLTKYLKLYMNCDVDIIEIDYEAGKKAAEFARNAYIGELEGNVEENYWFEKLEHDRYDYIIFADVLEHLYCPENVLKKCRMLLKEDGAIIISIPNVAHNAVILNLVQNEFQYNKIGLLDDTHIRFFTYKSLKRMVQSAGYVTINEKATYKNVEDTEFAINYKMFDKNLTKLLKTREFGNIYQYVFKIKKAESDISKEVSRTIQLSSEINYEFVCYIKEDTDQEFSENRTIRRRFCPGNNKFEIDLSEFNDVQEIRIDPIGTNCLVNIIQIKGWNLEEEVLLKISSTNGINIIDNEYLFITEDPQIYISEDVKGLNKVTVLFVFNDYDMDKMELYERLYNRFEFENSNLKKDNKSSELENSNLKNNNNLLSVENSDLKVNKNELELELENLNTVINNLENSNQILRNDIMKFTQDANILNLTIEQLNIKLQQSNNICTEKERVLETVMNSKWWRLRFLFKRK